MTVISTLPEPVRSETEFGGTTIVAPGTSGDKMAVTFTLPAKPFRLERAIRYVPCDPRAMERDSGLADIVKSGLFNVETLLVSRVLVA